jgi:hypothetical protein
VTVQNLKTLKHRHLIRSLLNPDGIQRFSTWVNSNKSTNLVTDPNDREFNEGWPREDSITIYLI